MKKTLILLTLLAVALAAGVLFVSCDTPESNNVAAGGGGGGDPTSITYTGFDETYTYKLTINKDPNRAAFSPVVGDLYVLLIILIDTNTQFAKSSGTVTLAIGGEFTLSNNGAAITVSINGSGISSFSGAINFGGGGNPITPGKMTPGSPPPPSSGSGGSVSGTYYSSDDAFFTGAITFNDPNFTMTGTVIGQTFTITGTYTVSGNTITCTVVTSSLSITLDDKEIFKSGDKQTFTILDEYCIQDEGGDNWIKNQ